MVRVKNHIDTFLKSIPQLKKVITSSSLVEKRLLKWGISQKTIKNTIRSKY